MNDKITENKKTIDDSKKCSFIIIIKSGEINIITSGQKQPFVILNNDSQQVTIKNTKDCFMDISSVLKTEIEKWKE